MTNEVSSARLASEHIDRTVGERREQMKAIKTSVGMLLAAMVRLRFAARACHSSFSSAVHALQHQKLAWNRLLPVTPEVASSSLVDPAIYLKVQHLHC